MHVQADELVLPTPRAIPEVFATLVQRPGRGPTVPVAVARSAPAVSAAELRTEPRPTVVPISPRSKEVRSDRARDDEEWPAYVVVDDQLRVLDHDAAATRLFARAGSELTILRGTLTAASLEAQRILASSINAAGAEQGNQPRTCKLSSKLRFQLYPLFEVRCENRGVRAASSTGRVQRNHLIVFSAPQRLAGIPDVASRYRLSRSETRLLEALCTDSRLKDYAHMNNVSTHTVRTQLRSILAKLGVHSQIEAVRTVLHSVIACA